MADEGAALAAELARRTEAEAAMAAALVELERHPGHLTLSCGATTGVTAQRWATASAALTALWQDFATYRGVLDAARARPAVLAPLQAALEAVARRCGELVAVRHGWAAELDALAAALIAAETLSDEVERAQRAARELIAGAGPVAADPVPHLRSRRATGCETCCGPDRVTSRARPWPWSTTSG